MEHIYPLGTHTRTPTKCQKNTQWNIVPQWVYNTNVFFSSLQQMWTVRKSINNAWKTDKFCYRKYWLLKAQKQNSNSFYNNDFQSLSLLLHLHSMSLHTCTFPFCSVSMLLSLACAKLVGTDLYIPLSPSYTYILLTHSPSSAHSQSPTWELQLGKHYTCEPNHLSPWPPRWRRLVSQKRTERGELKKFKHTHAPPP